MDARSRWHDLLEHAELTDVGLRRANNQDSFGLHMAGNDEVWKRRGHLFLVADGMGAHAAGELASKIAVDTVTLTYFKLPDPSAADAIRNSVIAANAKIHATGEDNPDFKGMGTTCSALVVLPQGAVAAHVGDSRVYRLRGETLEQLSRDHSLIWEMTANAKLHERDMPTYIPKNIITRSLGPSEEVQVDLEGPFPLVPGDTFLLCSDGLSGQVRDEELGVILMALPPQEAVRVLIDLANLRGGPDNITVIVVRVKSTDGVASAASASAKPPEPRGTVHPFAWIALGVFVLYAGLMFYAERFDMTIVGLVGAMIAAIIAFWQRFAVTPNVAFTPLANLGTGPHRNYTIQPSRAFLQQLNDLIEPVCQTARDQQWTIDWKKFETWRTASDTAAARGDYLAAARELCRGVTFLMQEVRAQRNRTTDRK